MYRSRSLLTMSLRVGWRKKRQWPGAPAQHHQPGSMSMSLGLRRGTVATPRSETSRKGRGTMCSSSLSAPPLLAVEPAETETNSTSTGGEGVLAGTGGREGGGWDALLRGRDTVGPRRTCCRRHSLVDTAGEGVGHPEIGEGDGMGMWDALARGSGPGGQEAPAGC